MGPEDASLHELFDAMPFTMGIVEIDDADGVVFLHGSKPASFAPPAAIELFRASAREAEASGRPVVFEVPGPPEQPGAFSISVAGLGRSAAGRPRFGFVTLDITVHRRTEERLQSILKSAPGFIFTVDRDLKLMSFNGPIAVDTSFLIGRSVLIWVPAGYAGVVQAEYEKVLRTGEVGYYETPTLGQDGAVRAWHASDVGPLRRDGEIVGLTVVSTDITARKRLEEQLERKNALLEEEIEERRRTEELLRAQQEEILALSAPLLKVGDGVLAVPVIGCLDEARAARIMEKLLHEIVRSRVRVAILDLTSASTVDSVSAGHLLRIARAAGLLGSRCVLSGISPRIARTMIELGVDGGGFATFRTLEDALSHARSLAGDPRRH